MKEEHYYSDDRKNRYGHTAEIFTPNKSRIPNENDFCRTKSNISCSHRTYF